MTDQERDLRAHLRDAHLPPAPQTLHMALHRVADGAPPRHPARRRTTVLLAAAALLLLGGAALGAGGVLDGRPDDMRTAPAWSPNTAVVVPSVGATPSPTGSDADASLETPIPLPSPDGPCPTETARILTGEVMPRAMTEAGTIAQGRTIRGAYVTQSPDGGAVPAELWAVQDGAFRRIAVITGSMNTILVSDVSRDGQWILVTLGRRSGGSGNSQCMDLYAIASDGSTVTQLTHNSHFQEALDGRFSSDGRFVAFHQTAMPSESGRVEPVLVVWDSASGTTREYSCGYTAPVAWAADAARVASLCGGTVLVVDAATGETGVSAIQVTNPWAIGWTGPASILVATDSDAWAPEMSVTQLTLADGSLSGTFGAPATIALSGEPVSGTLAVQAGADGLLVQVANDPEVWGFGLDLAAPGASPVQVAKTEVIDAQWTDAADAIIVDSIVNGVRQVDLVDVATGTRSPLVAVPLVASVLVRAASGR